MNDKAKPLDGMRSEGDLNISQNRVGLGVRRTSAPIPVTCLKKDERFFLRQSLSTPCLNVLAKADGIYIRGS